MNDSPGQEGRLGVVVKGSLTDGLRVRLDRGVNVEDVRVGRYVTARGKLLRFFAVVSNVSLETSDAYMSAAPPDVSDPFIAEALLGTAAFGALDVEPVLALSNDPLALVEGPQPAKTIPPHFSPVHLASEDDVRLVFGEEDERHFWIGSPLDMETRLCLDVPEFVMRSNGVFGKSGTGKTFLTRLLLAGILQSGAASNLVFDMQSEYGWKGYSEDSREVKGLKQLFPSRVAVFSLDEESSRRRGLTPDYVVRVGLDEVEPEDVQLLRESLSLSDVAADAAYSLQRHFGKSWLAHFLEHPTGDAFRDLAGALSVNERALSTLKNRLSRLKRLKFMDKGSGHDSVGRILQYLDRGMHVVLEFGRYGSDTAAYVLVANLLTRRIYERYQRESEEAMGDEARKPRPLVITIEEAHKFLNPGVASQTTFGAIAREMRKYNVTLLVVDQRPSGIDDEVMSQLGTKLTCLLDNEKDLDAVMTGVSGSRRLRSVLARLESKRQALVFGHAVPMPVVIETREYGSAESYRELGFRDAAELRAQVERETDELFGPDD